MTPAAKRQRRELPSTHTDDAGLCAPPVADALDALVAQRSLSPEASSDARAALRALKTDLEALRTREAGGKKSLKTLKKFGKGAVLRDAGAVVECAPPAAVKVVGSFLLGCAVKAVVDVAVEMGSAMFKGKDYLNYKYHDKRLLYLLYLARHLEKKCDGRWQSIAIGEHVLAGDLDKPLLSVVCVSNPAVTLSIVPTYPSGLFDVKKLALDRGNVRPAGESSTEAPATPRYNIGVLVDGAPIEHLKLLHDVVKTTPSFPSAVMLLEAWCTRNRLVRGTFVLSAMLAELVRDSRIPHRASREHMLRAAFNAIRGGELATLRLADVPLTAAMDPALLERTQEAAGAALVAIDCETATLDSWRGIVPFIFSAARGSECVPVPLCTIFDAVVSVRIAHVEDGEQSTLDHDAILHVLKKALVDTRRVSRIERFGDGLFGLTLVSINDAFRKVDVRPDDVDATEFKKFWGRKAELRRFKDGNIVESLVWGGGLGVIDEMTRFAFKRNAVGDRSLSVHVVLAQAEAAAGLLGIDTDSNGAIAAFDELATVLRSTEGLPLSVSSVYGVSPYLRRCGVQPLRPNASGRFVEPLEIVAAFESTKAWPEDAMALTAAKAAFYVALRSGLAAKGLASKATISFLDIMVGGFVFRLRLRVDSEKQLLASDKGSEERSSLVWQTETRVQHHDMIRNVPNLLMGNVARLAKQWLSKHMLFSAMGDRAHELVEVLVASLFVVPHAQAGKSSFACFCQFLHLLAEYPWEVAPLVVALDDGAMEVDADIQDGSRDSVKELFETTLERFASGADGKAAMRVVCCIDEDEDDTEPWFGLGHGPEPVIVARICAASRVAIQHLDQCFESHSADIGIASLFATPLDAFDVVLHLDKAFVPRSLGLAKGALRSSRTVSRLDSSFVGLEPVERLLADLEKELGHMALFLVDTFGGDQICSVWRPAAKTAVKFSLRAAPYMTPCVESGELEPDRGQMISAMERIGHGFIRKVSVRNT